MEMEDAGKEFMDLLTKACIRIILKKILRVANTSEKLRMFHNHKTAEILNEWIEVAE